MEDLSIKEIARQLGRAEATVKAYLYDPSAEKKPPRLRYPDARVHLPLR
jgi:transposase